MLYALAQAKRLAGDCPAALVHYRRFLDSNPPSQPSRIGSQEHGTMRRGEARSRAAHSSAGAGRTPAPSSTPPPDSRASVRAPEPAPSRHAHRGLLGIGMFLVICFWEVASLPVRSAGTSSLPRAPSFRSARAASRYDDAETHADRAHRDQKIAVVGAAVGGALVVAAIVRFVLHDDSPAGRTGAGPKVGASASGVVVSF